MRLFTLLSACFLALPLLAQESRVDATWYVRAEGTSLDARIVLEVEDGYHIYHTDLGHPAASGKPTTLSFKGSGVTFGEVSFPEPHPYQDMDWATNTPIVVNTHEGTVVLSVTGELSSAGSVPADLAVSVDGLVCNKTGCLPFSIADVAPSGKGDDTLFGTATPETNAAASAVEAQDFGDNDWLESGQADATLYVRRGEGEEVTAVIEIAIEDGYHLYGHELGHEKGGEYAKATELEWTGGDVEWEAVEWPKAHKYEVPYSEPGLWVWSYESTDNVVLRAKGKAPLDADLSEITLELKGQTCDDLGCVDYVETVANRGTGPDELFVAPSREAAGHVDESVAPPVEGGDDSDSPEEQEGLLKFLLLAVGWGLFALLMPCTYPMIPITISFFTKQAEARGGKVLPLALAYGAGIVLIFVAIGVAVGPVIIKFANSPWTNLVIGILFLYFSLVLFGFINMNPPKFLMNASAKASMKGGYIGVFLMGATLVVTSFTCTGPFVGSLLASGAQLGQWQVALGMGVFGLTMAIPFVFLSLVPGKVSSMPQAGMWMDTIKHTLGFVEVAAALKFISNADIPWNWNVVSREVFLALWVILFAAAGLYLLGVVKFFNWAREKPGLKQGLIGVLFLAFSAYCGWGLKGNTMDFIMQPLIPPYSGGHLAPKLWDPNVSWDLVADDYDEALEVAKDEDKLLLVNFTGHI